MIDALKNNLFILKIIHKADQKRILITLIYYLWVAFVHLVFISLLFRYLINSYANHTPFHIVLFVLFVLWITQIGYSFFSNYYTNVFKPISDEKIYQYIQQRIFDKSITIKLADLDNPEYYNDFTKATNEAKTRAILCLDNLLSTISDIISVIVLAFVIVKINFIFIIISLVPILLNTLWGKKMDQTIFDSDMKALGSKRKMDYVNRAFFLKDYSKEMRTSNIKSVLFKQMKDSIHDIITTRKYYGKKIALYKGLIFFVNYILCYFFTIIFALSLYMKSAILLGDFVFVISSLNTLTQKTQSCIEDFFKIYNSKGYIQNLKDFILVNDCDSPKENQLFNIPSFEDIEFRNVSFQYNKGSKMVLKDVSLRIEAGKKVAIVGYNGAGKTTFVKLLLRLYDATEGDIKLNGLKIDQYDLKNYQALFSCIFQDFAVFGCTIGENVLCRSVAPEDENIIIEALNMSGLHDDMERKGYTIHSMLTKEFDDNGVVLSGGQLQKLAIARAFAADSKIIILDEPSSALDPISEYQMFQRFKNVYANKTLIYITHRIASSILADTICFVEDGKIIEIGSHEELMRLNQKYASLYRMQADQYKDYRGEESCLHA